MKTIVYSRPKAIDKNLFEIKILIMTHFDKHLIVIKCACKELDHTSNRSTSFFLS